MSHEILKSELDLFKPLQFQGSIENSDLIQYRPVSSITNARNIEFEIHTASDEYLDLQQVFLCISAKLEKPDGTDFTAVQDDRYSLVNNGLHSIFDQVAIYLNGTLINQSAKVHPYISYIEALTQNTKLSQQTHLASAGFIPPKYDEGVSVDSVSADLARYTNTSKTFELYGRMRSGLFNSDRLLLNGTTMHLIFYRSSDKFCTMGSAARAANAAANVTALAEAKPILNMKEMSIFARKVKLNPNLLNAHAKALMSSKALYPIKRSVIKVINIQQGQNSFVLENIVMGQMPSFMVLGLVDDNAYDGGYTKNPFAFTNSNLNFLSAYINGVAYPKTPYEPDYEDKKYARVYHDFLSALDATESGLAPHISYESYMRYNCLYAFNFNADKVNPFDISYINIPKEGYLTLNMKFKQNLTANLKLICYFLFDNTITIDEQRNVSVDYA